jgi:hypothetical protein
VHPHRCRACRAEERAAPPKPGIKHLPDGQGRDGPWATPGSAGQPAGADAGRGRALVEHPDDQCDGPEALHEERPQAGDVRHAGRTAARGASGHRGRLCDGRDLAGGHRPCHRGSFDSGNLMDVARAYRKRDSARPIIFAADKDHHLPNRPTPLPNVGEEMATAAAVDGCPRGTMPGIPVTARWTGDIRSCCGF